MADFVGPNGMYPTYMALVQGADGSFYGTTQHGGADSFDCASGCGTVFKITTGSTLSTIYSFHNTDGANPEGGLVPGTDGNFYGTALAGGAHGKGTVFKITPGGVLTTLYSFNGTDGSSPYGALVLATDGNFYGTTSGGGHSGCSSGCGTVFKITPGGTLTTLHKFDITDGARPGLGLVQGADGDFYGTTSSGGADTSDCSGGCGTVFKITSGGTLTTLHSFNDSYYPGPLVQAADGNFYGTTSFGGTHGNGAVLKITPGGMLTILHNFDFTDGAEPYGALVQGTDGNFYGTTSGGGLGGGYGYGTVFTITPGGTLTTLHSFDNTDGENPWGGLLQGTDGKFYGTTFGGGPRRVHPLGHGLQLGSGAGPVCELSSLASSRPLTSVTILGTNLTGATAVTFNGTGATFKVLSQYAIEATVPAFATGGPVQVTTPGGTLTSNVPFLVLCPFFSCPVIIPVPL